MHMLQLFFGVDLVFFSFLSCLDQVAVVDCWDSTKGWV